MTRICWRCQQPGADLENARGEPAHRECLPAYLPDPEHRPPTIQQPTSTTINVEDSR